MSRDRLGHAGTQSLAEQAAPSTEPAPPPSSAMSIIATWAAWLSFSLWAIVTVWIFIQKETGEWINKGVLAEVDLALLALGTIASWILIVRKAWAARTSRWRLAAVAIGTPAGGAAVFVFLGLWILLAGVGP